MIDVEELEYWKKRCELAEMYIDEVPCDSDITMNQLAAYSAWNHFKNLTTSFVIEQNEQLVCEHKYQNNVCDSRGVMKCIMCGRMKPTKR